MQNSTVQEYKEEVKKQAEQRVLEGFPEVILKLNKILDTAEFKNWKPIELHLNLSIPVSDSVTLNDQGDLPPPKKTKLDTMGLGGSCLVPTNAQVANLIETISPHIRKFIEDSKLIKMWISFLIPKMEVGNNFGVSIQAAVMDVVHSVEIVAVNFFNDICKYFKSRGNLIAQVAKYPYIEDYRRAVQELDEKEYLRLGQMMLEIRNAYCSLHDVIVKNLEKIKKPRASNATESMF